MYGATWHNFNWLVWISWDTFKRKWKRESPNNQFSPSFSYLSFPHLLSWVSPWFLSSLQSNCTMLSSSHQQPVENITSLLLQLWYSSLSPSQQQSPHSWEVGYLSIRLTILFSQISPGSFPLTTTLFTLFLIHNNNILIDWNI